MFLRMLQVLLACGTVLPAFANQYWVAYEGDDYPENGGWGRVTADGGAERSIEDGILLLDGSRSALINDVYSLRHEPLDPVPGETFIAEWRFSLDAIVGVSDPGVAVFSDTGRGVGLSFSKSKIHSGFENADIPFDFDGFHEFVLSSADMRRYALYIDGILIREGQFLQVASTSTVAWGDGIEGAASISRWDYVRFGVVPESATISLLVFIPFVIRKRGI